MDEKIFPINIYKILIETVFSAQPLSVNPDRFKTRSWNDPRYQDKWDTCMENSENAERCIQYLYDKYPLLIKPCEVLVPGPAAAVVTEGNKIIGVATPDGDIKALSEPVPISSLPHPPHPPPSRPGVPPPPPPPPPMPVVKVSSVPGAKKALKEEIEEQKASGNIVDASALKGQLKELKKVVKEEISTSVKAGDWKSVIREGPKLKKVDIEAVAAERLRRQKERELTEDPRVRHLAAIQEHPQLKKVDIEAVAAERLQRQKEREFARDPRAGQLAAIHEGKQLRKAGSCGYNMIWDPRLRKCVAVNPELSEKDIDRAIGMSIAILDDDDIETDECIIS
jgi:hypothetical protein